MKKKNYPINYHYQTCQEIDSKRKFTKEKKKTMKQKTNPLPSKLPPMVSVCVAPKLVQNLSIYSCLSEKKKQKKFPLKNKKT